MNVFEQLVKNDIRSYENISKTDTGEEGEYRNGCLLDYKYFTLDVIGLYKRQALNIDPKGM